jgi:hypothetical protein
VITPDPKRALVLTLPETAVIQRQGHLRLVILPRECLAAILAQLQEESAE